MKVKIGLAMAGLFGLALIVGAAWAQESPKQEIPGEEAPNEGPPQNKPIPQGMVLVPAGEFIMGMSADDAFKECQKYIGDKCQREWYTCEEPVHKVYLDAYYIDKYEVTQAEYGQCVAAGECPANEKQEGFTGTRQPVVGVTWDDARSYCSWVGKRLPTEAEWEKAARGPDGRMYPWGNEFDGKRANFCDKNCTYNWALKDLDDGFAKTAPVGSYPRGASPYGALDMAGNANEWVADWYQENYYRQTPDRNPRGPDTGTSRVFRGGGWLNSPSLLHLADRDNTNPSKRAMNIGFRCAGD